MLFFSAKQDTPQTVDEILQQFNTVLSNLETVKSTNLADADRYSAEAAELVSKSKNASVEAQRAESVIKKISALIS